MGIAPFFIDAHGHRAFFGRCPRLSDYISFIFMGIAPFFIDAHGHRAFFGRCPRLSDYISFIFMGIAYFHPMPNSIILFYLFHVRPGLFFVPCHGQRSFFPRCRTPSKLGVSVVPSDELNCYKRVFLEGFNRLCTNPG